jgi:virginiamycin B lyase
MSDATAARFVAPGWKWTVPGAAIVVLLVGLAVRHTGSMSTPDLRGFEEYKLPDHVAMPVALAVAADRSAVWFTLESSNTIGVLRNGRLAFVHKDFESIEPLGLAIDASGAAWFTEAPKQAIVRAAADGSITSFALATPVSRLGRLAVGPDNTIWFTELTRASVTQFKDGRFIRHQVGVPAPGNSTDGVPFGVAVAPDGTVWATLQNADALLRIAPSGETTTIDVPIRQSGLIDIAVAKDGAVWFLAAGANKIGRYAGGRFESFSVPTPNAGLTALAVAPDGAAWFTALRAHRLGRVNHQGVVTEFALPRGDARPISIAVDADNNVWYADLAGWIGKLSADRARAR